MTRGRGASKAAFVMTTCPRCGAPIPMAAKFCANCGAPSELGQAANAAFDAVLDSARAKTRLPENTRAVDLEAETIRAFRAEMLEPLKRAGRELSVNVIDLEVGNVGGHAGQFVTATVLAPSDPAGIPAALALILSNFAGDPTSYLCVWSSKMSGDVASGAR